MAAEPDGRVLDGLGDDVPMGGDGDADLGFGEVLGWRPHRRQDRGWCGT
jgi:hypothetical protein